MTLGEKGVAERVKNYRARNRGDEERRELELCGKMHEKVREFLSRDSVLNERLELAAGCKGRF